MFGTCIWLYGLSGAGKSTIAESLFHRVAQYHPVESFDGDKWRAKFHNNDFSHHGRLLHLENVALKARQLVRSGSWVICAFITPYEESREYARQLLGEQLYTAYVECPLSVCEQRDPKGLYKRARAGEIKQFTGIDDPFEEPFFVDRILHTDEISVEQAVETICRDLL